jgi:hypothetical protein
MECIEYIQTGEGVIERRIQRVFTTRPVNVGGMIYQEVIKLKKPREISRRLLNQEEIPEVFKTSWQCNDVRAAA